MRPRHGRDRARPEFPQDDVREGRSQILKATFGVHLAVGVTEEPPAYGQAKSR